MAYRVKPKTIATRQMESAKVGARKAVKSEDGSPRLEVIVPAAVVIVGLVTIAVVRRVRG